MPCTCPSSQQLIDHGGLPPLQPQQEDDPGRLTDAGTRAFACVLAAADPADRPTLEHLCLDGQLAIGAATAAALATAPFRQVSRLSLNYGGALQPGHAEASALSAQRSLCDEFTAKPCLHDQVRQMWLHLENESSRPKCRSAAESTLSCPTIEQHSRRLQKVHASLRDSMRCCVTGMDDAGLLHLAANMPQLLHLCAFSCTRITAGGLVNARAAAASCSQHGMVIDADPQ